MTQIMTQIIRVNRYLNKMTQIMKIVNRYLK